MFTDMTVSWTSAGLITFSMAGDVNDELTGQTLVSYVAPTAWVPFGFKGGSVTIGGSAETNIIGDGSVTIGASVRTDAYGLGRAARRRSRSRRTSRQASGTFGADFNDLTNITRVSAGTVADVVFKFEGATIASTYKQMLQVTLKDCIFTSPSPTVGGPGPVGQTVSFRMSSAAGNPP
jgi:hypothetical protein